MGTTEITNTLQKDGIISDAREFEQYIIDQGQATRLQNGSFTLQKDMSYAAILKALTK
ncbi:endolytic transglycosylase MltG [Kurthia sp. Dielmo]|uniref:endolytic transglycosylase MltG n=1 Tax=Kurthia sp. Dielmo TaxID=1033738 RepID=UPI001645618E|nr:endolytic transglycosylase MltG [Kurthia sp. Dielmo]